MTAASPVAEWAPPTRLSAAIFEIKASGLRLARTLAEAGRGPVRLRPAPDRSGFTILAGARATPLWSDAAERGFDQGKVHNLRRAAMSLDGLAIPAGATFSFWRQIGRPVRSRGYAVGRMLREGCLVPSVGGGLCQLSNSLYQAALDAGCAILERHGHSRVVPGSHAEAGADATVAWNYVDLRFSPDRDLVLAVTLTRDALEVSLRARVGAPAAPRGDVETAAPMISARSCATCEEVDCFRHEGGGAQPSGRSGFVVDGAWPEFRRYVIERRRPGDVIALPLDGRRWGRARYGWETDGFAEVFEAPLAAARRALAWRATPVQGPARRLAEVRTSAAIAAALGPRLGSEVTDLTVSQSLAPFLWRDGWLGGRTFRVLMTRLPMAVLEARLDAAFAAHPDRPTLADWRAPAWLADAEAEVLAAAEAVVTPHAEIAALFGTRAVKLDWDRPAMSARAPGSDIIAFPGPTVARKGAFEVREAARRLGLAVRPLGADLEGEGFWGGVRRAPPGDRWLDGVAAVVQPAVVEEAPRRLLTALAAGIPAIASPACGLGPQPGLSLVPAGDVDALTAAIAAAVHAEAEVASEAGSHPPPESRL